jgi:hypothetical protein
VAGFLSFTMIYYILYVIIAGKKFHILHPLKGQCQEGTLLLF